MSGTSLDGIDIACCKFRYKKKKWQFSIEAAQTFAYSAQWKKQLAEIHNQSGEKLLQAHSEYGRFLGQVVPPVYPSEEFEENRFDRLSRPYYFSPA